MSLHTSNLAYNMLNFFIVLLLLQIQTARPHQVGLCVGSNPTWPGNMMFLAATYHKWLSDGTEGQFDITNLVTGTPYTFPFTYGYGIPPNKNQVTFKKTSKRIQWKTDKDKEKYTNSVKFMGPTTSALLSNKTRVTAQLNYHVFCEAIGCMNPEYIDDTLLCRPIIGSESKTQYCSNISAAATKYDCYRDGGDVDEADNRIMRVAKSSENQFCELRQSTTSKPTQTWYVANLKGATTGTYKVDSSDTDINLQQQGTKAPCGVSGGVTTLAVSDGGKGCPLPITVMNDSRVKYNQDNYCGMSSGNVVSGYACRLTCSQETDDGGYVIAGSMQCKDGNWIDTASCKIKKNICPSPQNLQVVYGSSITDLGENKVKGITGPGCGVFTKAGTQCDILCPPKHVHSGTIVCKENPDQEMYGTWEASPGFKNCHLGCIAPCETCVPLSNRLSSKDCTSCKPGFQLEKAECIPYTCKTGSGPTDCKSCPSQSQRKRHDECVQCNPGSRLRNLSSLSQQPCEDVEAPSIKCPSDISIVLPDCSSNSANVSWTVTATDSSGEMVIPSCDKNSGDTFHKGAHTILCNVQDSSKNIAMCNFSVSILDSDVDGDNLCSHVDSCPMDSLNDADSDAFCANIDSCEADAENDYDSDALCANIDSCSYDNKNDVDSDKICGDMDSCKNDEENDIDSDRICADVDSCALDAHNDIDSDKVCGDIDSCKYDKENDADSDKMCGDVDSCKYDEENDIDSDRICADVDSCALDAHNDIDSDKMCGDVDSCKYDKENDADSDKMCGDVDSCKYDEENDIDSDRICADVDSCALDAHNDIDSDDLCGDVDSCAFDHKNDLDSDKICANFLIKDKDDNDCLPSPCKNGGICTDFYNDFICECQNGYRHAKSGKLCSFSIPNYCKAKPRVSYTEEWKCGTGESQVGDRCTTQCFPGMKIYSSEPSISTTPKFISMECKGMTADAGRWIMDPYECKPIICKVDEYVTNNQCKKCAPGKTTEGKRYDASGENTTCVTTFCRKNEYVVNHRCIPCAFGDYSAGGAPASGRDTKCIESICKGNHRVLYHKCVECPKHSTSKAGAVAAGINTYCTPCDDFLVGCISCDSVSVCNECANGYELKNGKCYPTICPENFYSDHTYAKWKCSRCAPGSVRKMGDVIMFGPTKCSTIICGKGKYVFNHTCMNCVKGTENLLDDLATGSNTMCKSVICEKNMHVKDHKCVQCPPGSKNEKGDQAAGVDTKCIPVRCRLHEHVSNYTCVPCNASKSSQSSDGDAPHFYDGDNAMLGNTLCGAMKCKTNMHVVNKSCVQCAIGKVRASGDEINGEDTSCLSCNAYFAQCKKCSFPDMCESCETGYYGRYCKPYGGFCSHGTLIAQAERIQDNQCGSCYAGYNLQNSKCMPYGGACANGTLSSQTMRIQDNQCERCDSGYYLTTSKSCVPYGGSCNNGKLRKITERTKVSHCGSCNAGYYLSTSDECKGYGGSCANGYLAPQQDRTQENHCVVCNPGYYLDSQLACVGYAGNCPNGLLIEQKRRVKHDHCGACMKGYFLNNLSCVAYAGTCPNGFLREISNRLQDNHCGKCNPGYFLEQRACSKYRGICVNGSLIEQTRRKQQNHCGLCNEGFYLKDRRCIAYGGLCSNGFLVQQRSRRQNNHCGVCNDGYYLINRSCMPYGGVCINGILPIQMLRTQHNHCAHCNQGFYLAQSKCIACEPGKYQPVLQNDRNKESCIVCSPGRFQNSSGMSLCNPWKKCPQGTVVKAESLNSTNMDITCEKCSESNTVLCNSSMKCAPGEGIYLSSDKSATCVTCKKFTYSEKIDDRPCKNVSSDLCPGNSSRFNESCICNEGYHGLLAWDNIKGRWLGECNENNCVCYHGTKSRVCVTHGTSSCRRCDDGYYLHENTCLPFGGTCANGGLISQDKRIQFDHCGSCNSGFYISNNSRCVPFSQHCYNGTRVENVNRVQDNQCRSCDNGYKLIHGLCVPFEGFCSHGTLIAQAERIQDNQCGSCYAGYNLQNSKCMPYGGACANGTLSSQTMRIQDNQCERCDSGYYLTTSKSCVPYGGSCNNGKLRKITERTKVSHCGSCNAGYYLSTSDECKGYGGSCANGYLAPQQDRTQENHCVVCNPGYYLDSQLACVGYAGNCPNGLLIEQKRRVKHDQCGACNPSFILLDGICLEMKNCMGNFRPLSCLEDCQNLTYHISQNAEHGGQECTYKEGYERPCNIGEGLCQPSETVNGASTKLTTSSLKYADKASYPINNSAMAITSSKSFQNVEQSVASNNPSGEEDSTGMIVGIIIGGVVVIGLISGIAVWAKKRALMKAMYKKAAFVNAKNPLKGGPSSRTMSLKKNKVRPLDMNSKKDTSSVNGDATVNETQGNHRSHSKKRFADQNHRANINESKTKIEPTTETFSTTSSMVIDL